MRAIDTLNERSPRPSSTSRTTEPRNREARTVYKVKMNSIRLCLLCSDGSTDATRCGGATPGRRCCRDFRPSHRSKPEFQRVSSDGPSDVGRRQPLLFTLKACLDWNNNNPSRFYSRSVRVSYSNSCSNKRQHLLESDLHGSSLRSRA